MDHDELLHNWRSGFFLFSAQSKDDWRTSEQNVNCNVITGFATVISNILRYRTPPLIVIYHIATKIKNIVREKYKTCFHLQIFSPCTVLAFLSLEKSKRITSSGLFMCVGIYRKAKSKTSHEIGGINLRMFSYWKPTLQLTWKQDICVI